VPLEYVNRCGDRYYALQGTTKTGKPKYYAARKLKGVALDRMPDGYEFYEHPEQGIVTIRKMVPSTITEEERLFLEEQTRSLAGIEYFIVSIQDDSLVVYTPANQTTRTAKELVEVFGIGIGDAESMRRELARSATYLPMFRFTLVDAERRLYSVERWCFRGRIDDWIFLESARPLAAQAKRFLPHLDAESFFELM
jgi:hypothetical protein